MRDVPLKIVADGTQQAPGQSFTGFVVRKDLIDSGQIRGFADLRGRTLAIPATGTGFQVLLGAALESGGLTFADVNLVEMSFGDQFAAFTNRSLDAGAQIEPLISLGEMRGLFSRWKTSDEIFPYHMEAIVMYAPSFIQNAPEAARRFMVGYLKGVRAYLAAMKNPAEREELIAMLMQKYEGPQDRAVYDRMTFPYIDPDGYPNRESLAYDVDWLFANGYLPAKPDLARIVDSQFVDYAIQRLGPASR